MRFLMLKLLQSTRKESNIRSVITSCLRGLQRAYNACTVLKAAEQIIKLKIIIDK